jgi:hypothetical protein
MQNIQNDTINLETVFHFLNAPGLEPVTKK